MVVRPYSTCPVDPWATLQVMVTLAEVMAVAVGATVKNGFNGNVVVVVVGGTVVVVVGGIVVVVVGAMVVVVVVGGTVVVVATGCVVVVVEVGIRAGRLTA